MGDNDDLGIAFLLEDIVANDTNYEERAKLVNILFSFACQCGYTVGYRIDPAEPEWPVAFIQLPQGQVSWHMPQFPDAWDGHTTEEKFARINAFVHAVRAKLDPSGEPR